MQKNEYERCLHPDCRILTKGLPFEGEAPVKKTFNSPLKLVYTGNISCGRWKSLEMIGKALDGINSGEVKALLYVYTKTPLTGRMKRRFGRLECLRFMGGVDGGRIPEIQSDADILIFAESFDLKSRLAVRMSFSTKIVDYLGSGRCIFAVGSGEVAPMDYFIKNDAAVTATSYEEIKDRLSFIINNPRLMNRYAESAWQSGKKHHRIDKIQQALMNDLRSLCK